ncbi:MAG: hypothetical protein Q8W46_10710 [Candidatus Palauibacterales bacterium]|nr:hypothetical protein [Candidatus Palauibacterales bacterium]
MKRKLVRGIRLGGVGAAVLLLAGATAPAGAQESVPVDRWLVSTPFQADSADDALHTDFLSAPGEVAVLPDRGRTVAGADWTLVRQDSVAALQLDDLRPAGGGRVVVYAHAYLKSAADRTIDLDWRGLGCTDVEAWLNGRSLTALGRPARVRIGFGYNTFLVKAVSGDCPFGLEAWIAPASADGLQGIRVQASRPYGDTRTGPAPWVVAYPDAGPEPLLGWKEDRLFGAGAVRLAAFAVTAIQGAKLKAKTGGEEVKREIEWLTPAQPRTVLMPIEFKTLREAVIRGEGMKVELEWPDFKSEKVLRLDPEALLQAFHSSIRLLGWSNPATGAGAPPSASGDPASEADEPLHPLANLIALPDSAGTTLVGEWKVPGWLSGFTLRLDVEGAPGDYRLGSASVPAGEILLCTGCRKGETIQLVVLTQGAWTRFPGVSIVDSVQPRVENPADAVRWLELLDEKGSTKYRERTAPAE